MVAWKVIILASLIVIPLVAGVWLWIRSKAHPGMLPLFVLAALVISALLAGGYILFDMWLVARNQGHF